MEEKIALVSISTIFAFSAFWNFFLVMSIMPFTTE